MSRHCDPGQPRDNNKELRKNYETTLFRVWIGEHVFCRKVEVVEVVKVGEVVKVVEVVEVVKVVEVIEVVEVD